MDVFQYLISKDWIDIAAIAAVLGLIYELYRNNGDEKKKRSAFALESTVHAYSEAYKYVENNNKGIEWIACASILERANRMSGKITEPIHKEFHEVHLERYRRLFADILGENNTYKTGAIFYGAGFPDTPIDDAAKASTKRAKNESFTEKSIPEAALKVIWDFAQFPKDYVNQVSGRFDDALLERQTFKILYPGLHEYLHHKRKYVSVKGQLKEREV